MKLVIRGAHYLVNGEILIPHFTGEYQAVDCDRYMKKEDLEDMYDESFIEDNKDNCYEYEGVKYYYAKYNPFYIDNNWELLSELEDLYCEDGYNY